MHKCGELEYNEKYQAEVFRSLRTTNDRFFIALAISLCINVIFIGYVMYDRKLDSEFTMQSTETTWEVDQDGMGTNNFINGIGDINGSESQKNSKNN